LGREKEGMRMGDGGGAWSSPVATSDDGGIGAAGCGVGKETTHFGDPSEISATREEVGREESCVVNAFDGHVGASEGGFEAAADAGTDYSSLRLVLDWCRDRTKGERTMLPTSVEPRAKKKITSRQPKRVNSFSVVPTLCRDSSSAAGAAAAMAMRVVKGARSFMVGGGLSQGEAEKE
jgi:hypothetical protein